MTNTRSRSVAKITIVGHGVDNVGQHYIKLKVAGSNSNLPPYSMADQLEPKKRLYPELGDAGCKLLSRSSQTALLTMLENDHHEGPPDFLVVSRLGSFGNFYVRPRSVIGKLPHRIERAVGSLDPQMLQKYRRRGTLRRWQEEVGALCHSNSRLMFTASLACTGPILSFVTGPRTGGFQITGAAESGKTTAAMVAGSIWGCHLDSARAEKGFSESWNSTLSALEETAHAHCDAFLAIDETMLAGITPQQRAQVITTAVFQLSEGGKKMRYNESIGAAWRFYFLSTSNLTLDEIAVAGRVPIDEQHRGRLTDIGLPSGPTAHGIYEHLHGFADGGALTDAIKERCRTTFGAPGYEFVRRIYNSKKTLAEAKRFVAARRETYIERARKLSKEKGVKPLERTTARFATVYAAGSLAIRLGIFTWRRADLLRATLSCQFDGITSAEVCTSPPTQLRSRLLEHLMQNRKEFWNLDKNKPSRKRHLLGSAPGYSQTFKGRKWLYLTSDQLKAIIGTGHDAAELKRQLVTHGIMATTGHRHLVQRPVFRCTGNKGYRWVHAFRERLLFSRMEAP